MSRVYCEHMVPFDLVCEACVKSYGVPTPPEHAEERISALESQLKASAAREERYREALEHIRGPARPCCMREFHADNLENHDVHVASEALAQPQDGGEAEK